MFDHVLIDVSLLRTESPFLPSCRANPPIRTERVRSRIIHIRSRDEVALFRPELPAYRDGTMLATILHRLEVIILSGAWRLFDYQCLQFLIVLVLGPSHEQVPRANRIRSIHCLHQAALFALGIIATVVRNRGIHGPVMAAVMASTEQVIT